MRKKIFLTLLAVFLIAIVIGIVKTSKLYPIIFQLLFNREIQLKKDDSNINFVLLGTGGGQHEGPDLTDTIIFASINTTQNKVVLVSIPRDLWIPDLNAKINSAYASGNSKKKNGGLILTKFVIEKIMNKPINYIARIDFNGFVKAVDLIGGIDVEIENTFDDYQYPVEEMREDLCGHSLEEATQHIATASPQIVFPCRYTHVHFDKGLQKMDGKTALVFVRTRYAVGVEGTDFARSKRQEKIIEGFRQKAFSVGTLLNVGKMVELYNILQDSIDADIKEEEIDDFIRLAQKMKDAKLQSFILDYGDKEREGLLMNPQINEEHKMQWVLIPRTGNGDFSEIHAYIACLLSYKKCEVNPVPASTVKK